MSPIFKRLPILRVAALWPLLLSPLASVAQPGADPDSPVARPGEGGEKRARPEGGEKGREKRGVRGFGDLSEEERQRVREALRKVWSSPELQEAREDLAEATGRYREVLHAAIEEVDPEVRPILAKILPQSGMPPGTPPPHPGPPPEIRKLLGKGAEPGVEKLILGALHKEIDGRMEEGYRGMLREAHVSVLEGAEFGAFRERLLAAGEMSEKMEVFREMRISYFQALLEAKPNLEGRLISAGKAGMGSRPGGGKEGGGMKGRPGPGGEKPSGVGLKGEKAAGGE